MSPKTETKTRTATAEVVQPATPPAAMPASLPATQHATQVLSLLERVLTAPDFDIDRAERLWAMQKEVLAEQARASFIAASSVMQGELPAVPKRGKIRNNAGNVQSTYALWEDVNTAIKPVLQRHGFALSFLVNQDGPAIIVTGILSHQDGHRETTEIRLAPDKSGTKNDVQAIGSAVSYGKRYTASALLNLTAFGEDDDGQAFGDPAKTDAVMAKVAEFETAIMEATDEINLQRIGAQVPGAGLPPRLQTRVRGTYMARLKELRAAQKEGRP